jgi:hypothetical protein
MANSGTEEVVVCFGPRGQHVELCGQVALDVDGFGVGLEGS